ncbi:hypothetical protein ID866_11579 [Astraeus odoratus]|nr:hypothetical protein ID866_11579 [Astraeus odoratus]
MLTNYAVGLKAWHILHSQPLLVDANSLKCCLEGANHMATPSSKHPLRAPFTPETIASIKSLFQLEEPLDTAVFACMSMCFWCVACLGKFTVLNLKSFNPSKTIMHAAVALVHNQRDGHEVIKFDIPWTKTTPTTGKGESVQCVKQDGCLEHPDILVSVCSCSCSAPLYTLTTSVPQVLSSSDLSGCPCTPCLVHLAF